MHLLSWIVKSQLNKIELVTRPDLGQCQLCPLQFHDLKAMRRHHKIDHNDMQTVCPRCLQRVKYAFLHPSSPLFHKCKRAHPDEVERKYKGGVQKGTFVTQHLRTYTLKPGENPRNVRSMATEITGLVDGMVKWYCAHCFLGLVSLTKLVLFH